MQRTLGLALSLSLAAAPAHACMSLRSLNEQEISKADTIFVGRLVSLSAASFSSPRASDQATTLTFAVERVVRGRQINGAITAYGYKGVNTEIPRSFEDFIKEKGELVEVGIVFPETIKANTACRYRDVRGDGRAMASVYCGIDLPVTIPFLNGTTVPLDHPTIIGGICASAYIRSVRVGSADDEFHRKFPDREKADILRSLVLPTIRPGWAAEFLPRLP